MVACSLLTSNGALHLVDRRTPEKILNHDASRTRSMSIGQG